jgi:hypothetical protein
MPEGQTDRKERMELAERWRQLGEKLRSRSPQAFAKMIDVLAASADQEEVAEPSEIDGIYLIH